MALRHAWKLGEKERRKATGCLCAIMELVSICNIKSASLIFFNACTGPRSIPEPALAWQSYAKPCSVCRGEFGARANPDKAQPFLWRFPPYERPHFAHRR